MTRPLPCIVCVDVEPNARADASANDEWSGTTATFDCLTELRPLLATSTGAPCHFAWFWRTDAQVAQLYGSADWGIERHLTLLRDLQRAGDELGIHVHLWRWDGERHVWVADHADPGWAETCIRDAVAAFARRLGPPCSSRLGDRWLSNRAVAALETLGVRRDLTLEPGMPATPAGGAGEAARGWLPSTSSAPRRPYRPSEADYRWPARWRGRRLWMIPLSTSRAAEGARRSPLPPAEAEHWIEARPNPLWLESEGDFGTVEIAWSAGAARRVEIRVGGPDGALFARGCGAGATRTGDWVRDGTEFWLLAADGERCWPIASVTLRVLESDAPSPVLPPSSAHARTLFLNLEPELFRSMVDDLLQDPCTRHLAAVARSDFCLDPTMRAHIAANLTHLAGGPAGRSVRFVTPEGLTG